MGDEYITKDICQLKHKEVDEVKQDIRDFRGCVDRKFSALNKWIIALLSAALLNAVLILLKGVK